MRWLLAMALVSACGGGDPAPAAGGDSDVPGGPFTLTFGGDATYAAHDGRRVSVALAKDANGEIVGVSPATVRAAGWSVTFTNALEGGVVYHVDHFIDVNGDARCRAADDLMWRRVLAPATGPVAITESVAESVQSLACEHFLQ